MKTETKVKIFKFDDIIFGDEATFGLIEKEAIKDVNQFLKEHKVINVSVVAVKIGSDYRVYLTFLYESRNMDGFDGFIDPDSDEWKLKVFRYSSHGFQENVDAFLSNFRLATIGNVLMCFAIPSVYRQQAWSSDEPDFLYIFFYV
ncbi:MAG: hypothetical protein AAB653_00785 [Patescibacteria group bacterium]